MKFAWVVVLVGCGSSGGSSKPLDCTYLASDNCWKTTAQAATSCLPASGTTGTLALDNASCTYASGQTITFAPALTLPLPSGAKTWNFTVTTNGTECLQYEEGGGGALTLTVNGEVFSETTTGSSELSLTCPDGTSYASSDPLSLLSCPSGTFGDLPGNSYSSSATSVSFSFINTGTPSSVKVFDCSR